MIGAKMYQTNVQRIHFLSRVSVWLNEKLSALVRKVVGTYALYRKIVHLFFFEFLPSFVYELLVKMKDYVAKKYYVMGDQIRGRRVLRSSGSVSFFLERLAEEKPNNQ